jgi:hypothetical protein
MTGGRRRHDHLNSPPDHMWWRRVPARPHEAITGEQRQIMHHETVGRIEAVGPDVPSSSLASQGSSLATS